MIIMRIAVGVVLYAVFFCMCYMGTGTDKKNIAGFRSYPDEVQNRVYQDEVLGKIVPKRVSHFVTLLSNFMLFTVVFSVLGGVLKKQLGLVDFKSAFWYFLILGEGLNLFDLVIIDLLWWRNTKRIRFLCVPEKEAYHNPKKHIESFGRGIPVFALAALCAGMLIQLF